ncbi:MAG: VanZ family protein [Clostridiales bacterium]|nr:VanZ family protein [Clostridiales bacterium]
MYIVGLCYFLFFAELFGRTGGTGKYHYNLILFKEIRRFWNYRYTLGLAAVISNLVGNVVGFMPFGFFVPILAKKTNRFLTILLLSFVLSLLIENTQLIFKVGSFDVDDLFLNSIGGILGYLVYRTTILFSGGKNEK